MLGAGPTSCDCAESDGPAGGGGFVVALVVAAGRGMRAERTIGFLRQFLQHFLDVVGGAAQVHLVHVNGDDATRVIRRPDGEQVGEVEELAAQLQIVGEEDEASGMGAVVAVVHAQHQGHLFMLVEPVGAAHPRLGPDKGLQQRNVIAPASLMGIASLPEKSVVSESAYFFEMSVGAPSAERWSMVALR